jgi:hypothetical protein
MGIATAHGPSYHSHACVENPTLNSLPWAQNEDTLAWYQPTDSQIIESIRSRSCGSRYPSGWANEALGPFSDNHGELFSQEFNYKHWSDCMFVVVEYDDNVAIANIFSDPDGNVHFRISQLSQKGYIWGHPTKAEECSDWTSTLLTATEINNKDFTFHLAPAQDTLQEVFPDTCPTGDCVACAVDTFKNYTGGADNCYACRLSPA